MPFPTTLVAEYLLHSEAKVAGGLFAGTFFAITLAFNGLWHHASKDGRLLVRSADAAEVKKITRQYWWGPVLYLTALAVSFLSAGLSVALCLCLAVGFAFTAGSDRH
jgi:hypothetical protein